MVIPGRKNAKADFHFKEAGGTRRFGLGSDVEVNSKLQGEPTLISDPHSNLEVSAENVRFRSGPSRRAKKNQDPRALPSLFNMKEGLSRALSV